MQIMKFTLLLLLVGYLLVTVNCSTARIRYVNSMPQFGSATVYAFPPLSTLFSKVPGGSITSYANLTYSTSQPYFVFTTTYPTNITALSFPFSLTSNQFYSLYTFQIQGRHILNGLLPDSSSAPNNSVAYLRTINLLQYDFPIDVFNLSNNVQLFSGVSYGNVTAYKAVPPGEYAVYWESSAAKRKKRASLPFNLTDPHLTGGNAYTHWVLPSSSFIIQDGVLSAALQKRSEVAMKDKLIDRIVNDGEAGVSMGEQKDKRRKKRFASKRSRRTDSLSVSKAKA